MEKIVIVMPTFNEAKNIGFMIEELFEKEFPKIKNAQMHLLVVDANSPDGTGEVVKGYLEKYENLHLLSKEKGGLGADYIAGFKYAIKELSADAVIEMDGDGQHPPDNVARMVDAYLAGADYVIGSRYIPGGSVPKEWEFTRRAVSYLGNLFIRTIWLSRRVHDMTTGFRLTRVNGVLDNMKLDEIREQKRFAYKIDLLYKTLKRAKKVVEVPLEFKPRTREKSKFNTNEMIATFKLAVLIAMIKRKKFIKFGIVGFIGFLVNAIGIELFVKTRITIGLANASESLSMLPGLKIFTEPSSWAGALGAEMAIISNFALNNLWTFKENKITKVVSIIRSFIKFNLTSLGAVIIQFIVIGSAVVFFGDSVLVRQLALVFSIVFLIVPYNYTMYNLFIWKSWDINRIKQRLSRV